MQILRDKAEFKDGVLVEVEGRVEFKDADIVQGKALALDTIKETTKQDIRTLECILRRYSKDNVEVFYDKELSEVEIGGLRQKLKEQQTKTKELICELNEKTQEKKNFPQDSSDVHQTDFNS